MRRTERHDFVRLTWCSHGHGPQPTVKNRERRRNTTKTPLRRVLHCNTPGPPTSELACLPERLAFPKINIRKSCETWAVVLYYCGPDVATCAMSGLHERWFPSAAFGSSKCVRRFDAWLTMVAFLLALLACQHRRTTLSP